MMITRTYGDIGTLRKMIVVVQVTVVVTPCEVHGSVWTADDVGDGSWALGEEGSTGFPP